MIINEESQRDSHGDAYDKDRDEMDDLSIPDEFENLDKSLPG